MTEENFKIKDIEEAFYAGFAKGVEYMTQLNHINDLIRIQPNDLSLIIIRKDLLKVIEDNVKLANEGETK